MSDRKEWNTQHGDEAARSALAAMISGTTQVRLPRNGEVAEMCFASSVSPASVRPSRPAPVQWRARRVAQPKKQSEGGTLGAARKAVALIPEVLQVGWRPDAHEILLYVAFPGRFQKRRETFLRELSQSLGTPVVVKAKNTSGEFAALARKHLPFGAKLVKPPSLFAGERAALKVRFTAETDLESRERYVANLSEKTGFSIELLEPGAGGVARELVSADGRMELNTAYRVIKQSLEEAGLLVFRCGKKQRPDEFVEVGLLAPWLLEPHAELVKQLERETGYSIRAAGPNQTALEKKVRELLPPAWQVLKPFRWSGREARLELARLPETSELESVAGRVRKSLGVEIKI